MPTNRDSAVIHVEFRIPSNFTWMSEDALSALRGGNTISDTIEWVQGDPAVGTFTVGDISVLFYSDSAGATEIADGATLYSIGDEDLDDIITLTNFTDAGDGTGTVDIQVDPSGITSSELTALRNVYVRLRVSQPDAGD